MFWFGKKKRITDLPVPPFAEVKKRTRILVVDDDSDSFPYELMRREQYSVEHWPKVESLAALEDGQYDIIILDIQGVAQHISPDDGLGVLELIKKSNPSQIVVAFSSHQFDLSKNRFWRMADDSLCKPVNLAMCKRLIDSLIESKQTPQHYWESISQMLARQGMSTKEIAQLESKVVGALGKRNTGQLKDVLGRTVENAEVVVRVVGLGVKIAALFGI